MVEGRTLGLVGCGKWGRHILRDLVSLGCRVTVVARSDESRARAREGGAAAIVPDVARLEGVDGVVVATPTTTHGHVTAEALALGVPVFVEKPLTCDADEADRLAAAAGDRLFVMDKWRYHPGVALLAELARDGSLGAVRSLHTTRIGWGKVHDDVDSIWVLAPHDLAIGLEILGELPSVEAAVAEDGEALLGVLGRLRLEVSARSPVRRREVRLVCEHGAALLSDAYADHVLIRRDGDESRREIGSDLPLLMELRAFVEHLDGGPAPRSSAADGALVVRRVEELRALAGIA